VAYYSVNDGHSIPGVDKDFLIAAVAKPDEEFSQFAFY
jgi:hypothetical protein